MTELTVAALQLAFSNDIDANIAHVSELVREAASRGAQVILPPELFEGEYFCRVEDEALFANAKPVGEHKAVRAMQKLAGELGVTIPTSFFEADGPGYEEKFYFRPGNTGF
ncbi:MAG: N-carbamoylputrescine amidase, partial [Sphingomonas bacterium]|uniref:nitrilase-related carbon-nitrogen hydrolase n=1 Tax=Sphingomonas bacterium TaxID=1895847 RepID=UPI00262DC0EA